MYWFFLQFTFYRIFLISTSLHSSQFILKAPNVNQELLEAQVTDREKNEENFKNAKDYEIMKNEENYEKC